MNMMFGSNGVMIVINFRVVCILRCVMWFVVWGIWGILLSSVILYGCLCVMSSFIFLIVIMILLVFGYVLIINVILM